MRAYSDQMNLSFPRGRSGLGLVILRGTIAAVILIIESAHLVSGWLGALSFLVMGLAILIGLGLLTSLVSALAAVLILALTLVSQSEPLLGATLAALSAAVALMGGGAYSIDGLLHGRRRITLPKT